MKLTKFINSLMLSSFLFLLLTTSIRGQTPTLGVETFPLNVTQAPYFTKANPELFLAQPQRISLGYTLPAILCGGGIIFALGLYYWYFNQTPTVTSGPLRSQKLSFEQKLSKQRTELYNQFKQADIKDQEIDFAFQFIKEALSFGEDWMQENDPCKFLDIFFNHITVGHRKECLDKQTLNQLKTLSLYFEKEDSSLVPAYNQTSNTAQQEVAVLIFKIIYLLEKNLKHYFDDVPPYDNFLPPSCIKDTASTDTKNVLIYFPLCGEKTSCSWHKETVEKVIQAIFIILDNTLMLYPLSTTTYTTIFDEWNLFPNGMNTRFLPYDANPQSPEAQEAYQLCVFAHDWFRKIRIRVTGYQSDEAWASHKKN